MTRKDLGTISEKEWLGAVNAWEREKNKYVYDRPEGNGSLFCWHDFQGVSEWEIPSGLEANVIIERKHGKKQERLYCGKQMYLKCIKCGKIILYSNTPYSGML